MSLDVYEPAGTPRGVVGLIHGGFWRAMYGPDQFVPHARALAHDGFVVGNVGYRRVGEPGGGFRGTCDDAAAALRVLRDEHGPLTAVVGHSAGGHLALWAAKDQDPRPRVVVSVAGVNDLSLGRALDAGRGAIDEFVGDIHALGAADPAQRLPLGTRAVLVVPDADTVVPAALSESYERLARAAGDDVVLRRIRGDHFSVLDVDSDVWAAVVDAIVAAE